MRRTYIDGTTVLTRNLSYVRFPHLHRRVWEICENSGSLIYFLKSLEQIVIKYKYLIKILFSLQFIIELQTPYPELWDSTNWSRWTTNNWLRNFRIVLNSEKVRICSRLGFFRVTKLSNCWNIQHLINGWMTTIRLGALSWPQDQGWGHQHFKTMITDPQELYGE